MTAIANLTIRAYHATHERKRKLSAQSSKGYCHRQAAASQKHSQPTGTASSGRGAASARAVAMVGKAEGHGVGRMRNVRKMSEKC